MILSHKIALDPTEQQRRRFVQAAGTARFAWNWALAEWQRQYKAGEKPNHFQLRRQLNAIKAEQFPWLAETSKAVPASAINNLGIGFRRFFQRGTKHPQFKKKGVHDSFCAADQVGTWKIEGCRIRLPRIGWVKLHEPLRFNGKAGAIVTVSRVADRWFASVRVEIDHVTAVRENQAAVGVDLGVLALATLSDGRVVPGPKALRRHLGRLRRLDRAVSRKQEGSANRRKAKARIARLHARISNIRADALHKLTTELTRSYTHIGIEDLNVAGMKQNRRLARAISDVGMWEFRRQLQYKAVRYGATVITAGRFYPSSKTCSACGQVLENLPLKVRGWTCPGCGVQHDRDHNAAINLRNLAAGSAVTACGAEGSGHGR